MFIMIPTKGWDERARTAPVPASNHQYQDTTVKKTIKDAKKKEKDYYILG